ncbi:MAG: hypothetical protein IJK02_05315, partial [Clostridia bacterium]|nr:hypothetical protein [Clostridia bacterium]
SDYNANKAANGLALYVTANVSSPHYVGVRSWAGSASDICVDSNGPVVMLFKQGSNTCVGFFGYRQFCVFGGFNGPGAPWSDCWAAWSDTSVGYQVFADLGGPGYGYYNYWSIRVPYSGVFRDFPVYASAKAAIAAYAQALGNPTLKGVMADTSVVDLLGELPEGAEMGGLAVAGAGAGVDALEDVIESGVMERQKPAVRPVEVEIGEGAEVDADAGTVTEETPSVITITPESVPLSVSDYAVPGLHTLFPFSVPWDIARVWQALDAEPRWFLEDVVLTFPAPELWGGEPLVVTFRMEDMPQQLRDAVQGLAATVRAFLLIIACIGFLVFAVGFIKF